MQPSIGGSRKRPHQRSSDTYYIGSFLCHRCSSSTGCSVRQLYGILSLVVASKKHSLLNSIDIITLENICLVVFDAVGLKKLVDYFSASVLALVCVEHSNQPYLSFFFHLGGRAIEISMERIEFVLLSVESAYVCVYLSRKLVDPMLLEWSWVFSSFQTWSWTISTITMRRMIIITTRLHPWIQRWSWTMIITWCTLQRRQARPTVDIVCTQWCLWVEHHKTGVLLLRSLRISSASPLPIV